LTDTLDFGIITLNGENNKMAAGTYNFTVEQGATFTRLLTLKENDSAMNLTGYSAASQMRSTADTSTVAGTFTATVSNAGAGQITLSMTATQTGNIEEGIYVYDTEITSGAGAITRILQGKVTVTANVTR
tara:strand:+ start:49 stop:438 length:390 start_codon:yes stop_codon:yes gene_type:complete